MSGEVPEGWSKGGLGQFLRAAQGGGTPPRENPAFWNGDIPWASVKDMTSRALRPQETITPEGLKNSTSRVVAAGTNILALRMAVGSVARYAMDIAINQDLVALVPDERLDPDFLFHWLSAQADQLKSVATGTTVKGLRKDVLLGWPILLPPLDEQRRIAEVLRSVDDAASLAAEAADQNRAFWEALVDDLIWRPTLENDTLLEPLGHSIKAADYGVNAPLHDHPNGIAVLRMGNIQQGQIDLTKLKWGEIAETEAAALKLCDGDILFNRTNSRDLVGKVALVRGNPDYLYASYLVRLSIDRSIAAPYFVFAAMNSRRGQANIQKIATPGVSQSNINPTNLKKLLFPRFGLERQQQISILLQEVEAAGLEARRQVERLRELRASVSSQLLSGRVRVPA